MKTIEIINKLNPCDEGAEYLRKYKNLKTAWKHCQRGDWMLWLAQNIGVAMPVLTLAKGLCANTVRHLMKDPRSIAAVDAAVSFGRGEITEKELADAADAAYSAAAYADADAYVYAAAAYAAADADAYATYTARKANLQQTADICRETLTKAVMEAAERGGEV